jgi:hypothetical protein
MNVAADATLTQRPSASSIIGHSASGTPASTIRAAAAARAGSSGGRTASASATPRARRAASSAGRATSSYGSVSHHTRRRTPRILSSPMRILYGVVGEGMGHAMRSRVVLEHLVAAGHEVEIMASGRAAEFLGKRFEGSTASTGCT